MRQTFFQELSMEVITVLQEKNVVIKALLESPALKLSTLFYKVCFCLWEGFRKTKKNFMNYDS
jgi:hypothetical protein